MTSYSKKLVFYSLILAGLILIPFKVQALGLIVRPDSVNLVSNFTQIKTFEILVGNNSDQPALYLIYPDNFSKQIKIEPESIKLEPNEIKSIKIVTRFLLPGYYQTNISVITKPLSAGSLVASPGVKLPLIIQVGGWVYLGALGGLILFCLGLIFGVKLFLVVNKHHNK